MNEKQTERAVEAIWGMFHIYLFGCLIPLGTIILVGMMIANQMGLISPPW